MATDPEFDLFIIGGGINGCAIAADAAGRGLRVCLCEKNDLGSGTSSWSTKLIHGGIRYLETYKFSLVRHSLLEREILMQRAPHLIKPLQFILPHEPHLRPKWMIQIGLALYDHLAKRKLIPKSSTISLKNHPAGKHLQQGFKAGFSYYDCQTDDNRLVILNALSAQQPGATILSHTTILSCQSDTNQWGIQLQQANNPSFTIKAKAIINAAGPWVNQVTDAFFPNLTTAGASLIKGSHIVVRKLFKENFAYILQTKDNRVVFAIPYQQDFTLIGTTDISFNQSPEYATATTDEKNYLLTIINQYFNHALTLNDIRWDFSGVRALYNPEHNNPSKITREHKIDIQHTQHPPLVTLIGGKLTTHRAVAEETVNTLQYMFPSMKKSLTKNTKLPMTDFNNMPIKDYQQKCQQRYPWLNPAVLEHYLSHYGSNIHQIICNKNNMVDLGTHFCSTLYAAEVHYLIQHEWAQTAEDILWRRTKYGLTLSDDEQENLQHYLKTLTTQ